MDEQETDAPDPCSIQQALVKGKKQERVAQNDVNYSEQRLGDQRKLLEDLLDYRDECARGLRSALNGLSSAQQRDYELLLQHLDNSVKAQQQRLKASEHEYEQSSHLLREVKYRNQEIDLLVKQVQKQQEELHQRDVESDHAQERERLKTKTRFRVHEPDDLVPGKPLKPSYR